MDKTKVNKYFDVLKSVIEKSELWDKPHCHWNMDETGLQLDQRPGKVVAAKGSKYLHGKTSGNRETITINAAISAAGATVPPHVIIKGKMRRSVNSFQSDAPEGTTWSWSETGWTKQGIGMLWFTKSFLPNIGQERPQILIVDSHDSHNFLELIDNNIHTACDHTVFGPFKMAYRNACDELTSYPDTVVSRSTFCSLLKRAWQKAVTSTNIQSGFRACGIYPFCPDSIPQEAFVPNQLYVSNVSEEQNMVQPTTSTSASEVVHSTPDTLNLSDYVSEEQNMIHPSTSTSEVLHSTPVTLNLSDYVSVPQCDEQPAETATTVSLTPTPPDIALELFEPALSAEQLSCYKFCYGKYDIADSSTDMKRAETLVRK